MWSEFFPASESSWFLTETEKMFGSVLAVNSGPEASLSGLLQTHLPQGVCGPVAERTLHLSHVQTQHPQSPRHHGESRPPPAAAGQVCYLSLTVLCVLCVLCAQTSLPCVDTVVLDVDRLGDAQPPGGQRAPLNDGGQPSISLEPLSPAHPETTLRAPADITVAVTSESPHSTDSTSDQCFYFEKPFLFFVCFVSAGGGRFFNRSSGSPRNVVCEMELPDIQASLDHYDDNKS